MDKVIITAALTGAITSRTDTPYVPLTKEEISSEARRCEEAGAAVVHLHLRDETGRPALGTDRFIDLVAEVRARSQVVICLSTSSWGAENVIADRVAAAEARPEMVSFHVGSMNRGDKVFSNPLEYQMSLIEATRHFGIKPEFELFDLGHLTRAAEIHRTACYPDPLFVQFVLGARGGCPAEPRHLLHMVETLPPGALWSVAAVGRAQLPLNLMGLILGGHVRTGLEDNIYLRRGVLAASNAVLVERLAGLSRELGREPASAAEARALLGLV